MKANRRWAATIRDKPMIPVSCPSLGQEELDAVKSVFESGWLGLGSVTDAFEQALKDYLRAKNVIAVNTGTSALHLALDGFGIGAGDEVIVPSLTFVASIQAIIATGATPVFCEVLEDSLLIDVDDVEQRMTAKTRAIMPVHYCGSPCDMDALLDLADAHQLTIIEDAAHAFGSTYKGRKIGSFGHVTCFSFDPIKIFTCGEGGAIVLSDDDIAEEVRRKRLLGIDKDTWHRYRNERSWFYEVTTLGYRYHMSNINAAIGLAQLEKVEYFIARRREICRRYDAAFTKLQGIRSLHINYDEVAPFMYVVRVPGCRNEFMDFLRERGIATGVHYIANHTQPFFQKYARDELPRTTRLCQEIVTLPLYYAMSEEDVQKVVRAVRLVWLLGSTGYLNCWGLEP